MRPRRGLHDPREEQGASFQDLRRCLNALSAATDLAGCGDACRQPAGLSCEPWLRSFADGIREEALRGDPDGRHGSHRRRPRRSGQASGRGRACPCDGRRHACRRRRCLRPEGAYTWSPEAAPSGPVSIIISTGDQQVVVLRNGVEIGRAHADVQQQNQRERGDDLPAGADKQSYQVGVSRPHRPTSGNHQYRAGRADAPAGRFRTSRTCGP